MVVEEFISKEQPQPYKLKVGSLIASSLTGFLAGVVFGGLGVALIFWAMVQSRQIIHSSSIPFLTVKAKTGMDL